MLKFYEKEAWFAAFAYRVAAVKDEGKVKPIEQSITMYITASWHIVNC